MSRLGDPSWDPHATRAFEIMDEARQKGLELEEVRIGDVVIKPVRHQGQGGPTIVRHRLAEADRFVEKAVADERRYWEGKLAAIQRENDELTIRVTRAEAQAAKDEDSVHLIEHRAEIAEAEAAKYKSYYDHVSTERNHWQERCRNAERRLEKLEAETPEQRKKRLERYERERQHAADENILAEEAADRAISGGGSLGVFGADERRQWPLAMPREDAEALLTPQRGDEEIDGFTAAMKRKLRANDHKGGWDQDDTEELVDRLLEETQELIEALGATDESIEAVGNARRKLSFQRHAAIDTADVQAEAADVGNFAMMIWDKHQG